VLNTPGTIDADYRGEIKIILMHLGQSPFVIERGMRIAQMVIAPVTQATWQEVPDVTQVGEDLDRVGGFGSSGV
jgi:dUTP pyrophosphatase